jgi:hypothetical protein
MINKIFDNIRANIFSTYLKLTLWQGACDAAYEYFLCANVRKENSET